MTINSKELKLISAIALQVIVILGIVIYKMSILIGGTDIVLKTQPVDPRDFLRGDYVSLRYEINRLDLNEVKVENSDTFRNGNQIYVELEKTGEYFSAKRVGKNKPQSKYFIKGRVASSSGSGLALIYGIESYFIPEGGGKHLEGLLRGRSAEEAVLIGVKVDKLGDAVINKIIVGGEEINVSDFKKVEAGTRAAYEIERGKQEEEYKQTQDNSLKERRDITRRQDIENISSALNYYSLSISSYAYGIKKHMVSDQMPVIIEQKTSLGSNDFKVPSDPLTKDPYIWIDNTGTSAGYCFYAILETSPVTYYVASSAKQNTIRIESTAPQTLEDCGIKKPIAGIEGYIFIDKNKNTIFDKEDTPFLDANVGIHKMIEKLGPDHYRSALLSETKPDQNGYYKFEILDPDIYNINPVPTISTRIGGIGRSGSGWLKVGESGYFEIKGGEKITDANYYITFD